jgi:hypothetical protein
MLCDKCHKSKSQQEPKPEADHLASYFCRRIWENYEDSPPLPPLITKLNEIQARGGPVRELDVRRCRRNALFHSPHPLPVFCVYDDIQGREDFQLGDLNYIDLGDQRWSKSRLRELIPYVGPRWYPRVAAEFMLHNGQCTWTNVQ